jgi:hypothetical protein
MSVYTSNSIKKFLRIKQALRSFEGAHVTTNFHLEENETSLRVYLPQEEDDYELCLQGEFPSKFGEYLGISTPQALSVLGGILRLSSPTAIDKHLEREGVGQVDCPVDVPDDDSNLTTLVDLTEHLELANRERDEQGQSTALLETRPQEALTIPTPHRSTSSSFVDTPRATPRSFADTPTATPSPSNLRLASPPEPAYLQILENIVQVSRRRVVSGFFETGAFSSETVSTGESLSAGVIRTVFGRGCPDREFKIGAAGELYVRKTNPSREWLISDLWTGL